MADDISKKITIGVEMETESIAENISSLNKTIDSLLAKQQQLNTAGQQNSAAFEAVTAKLETFQTKLKEATALVAANADALNQLGVKSKATGGAVDSLTEKHSKHGK